MRIARALRAPLFTLLVLLAGGVSVAGAAGFAITGSGEGTGEKPQSKLWYNDGQWRGILKKLGHGLHFYEFTGSDWVLSQFVDASLGVGGTADVKWNGEELFVLAYSDHPQLFAYTYDTALRVFNLRPGFPVPLPIADGSETMVLDQDSTGRLWATYEGGEGAIYVCWSTSDDHREWAFPGLVIRTGVDTDDISTLVAFDGKIGVFWSDQDRDQYAFRIHRDDQLPEVWDSVKTVKSGSGIADDHLCLKADRLGNLYAVSKDVDNTMRLHYRSVTTGSWTTKTGVISGTGTRGIIQVAEADDTVYVPYTTWSSDDLHIILRKAKIGSWSFSTELNPLISGPTLNNCTGSKQPLPSGCFMVACEGGGKTWWNGWGELPPDGPPPPPPPLDLYAAVVTDPPAENNGPPLVFDLPLDEGAGATAADRSPAAATVQLLGTSTGVPAWVAGHAGNALQFDGQSTYAETPSSDALGIAGSLTVEAWVRWDGGASTGTVLSKGRSNHRNYQLQVLIDGTLYFFWETASGTNHTCTGSRPLERGVWQHVAAVYDAGAGADRLYVDGQLDESAADSGTPGTSSDALEIGAKLGSSGFVEFFPGALDAIRVWRGARYTEDFVPDSTPAVTSVQYDYRPHVLVAWSSPDPAQPLTYRVYRSANGGPRQRLGTDLAETVFADRAPVAGILCYTVTSVDSTQRESRVSQPSCTAFGFDSQPLPLMQPLALPSGADLALHASPNPFNPRTQIALRLPAAATVQLVIYDVAGRCVARLHDGPLAPGVHWFDWAADRNGAAASGVYFARCITGGRTLLEKLVLVQ